MSPSPTVFRRTFCILLSVTCTLALLTILVLKSPRLHRERAVFPFPNEEVSAITIDRPTATIALHREDASWRLTGSGDTVVDAEAVQRLLLLLGPLSMSDVVSANPENFAAYGVGNEGTRITVTSLNGSSVRILVGTAAPSGQHVYLRDASRDAVTLAPVGLLDLLHRPVDRWRDRTMLKLEEGMVSVIAVEEGLAQRTFTRSASGWTVDGALLDTESAAPVTALLTTLSEVTAESFDVAIASSFTGTTLSVVLTLQDGDRALTVYEGIPEVEGVAAQSNMRPQLPFTTRQPLAEQIRALLTLTVQESSPTATGAVLDSAEGQP